MIPAWLNEKLANPPSAGAGVHAWLFSVARQLHAHMDEAGIVACLTAATASCGRHVTAREIADAARNSREVAWVKGKPSIGNPIDRKSPRTVGTADALERWPIPCPITRAGRIFDSYAEGVTGVEALSARGGSCDGDCDDWLDRLLPDAEWICMASGHPGSARSRRREKWLFDESYDLMVPSPMTGPSGVGLDGKVTHRCLANTGARRWLVVEFDKGTIDEQAALHWHFTRYGKPEWPKLVVAVFSGGKSLHGWYGPIVDEVTAKAFMSYCVLHGADPATFTRCQLVRRPAALRRVPLEKVNVPEWASEFWPEFTERQSVVFYAE